MFNLIITWKYTTLFFMVTMGLWCGYHTPNFFKIINYNTLKKSVATGLACGLFWPITIGVVLGRVLVTFLANISYGSHVEDTFWPYHVFSGTIDIIKFLHRKIFIEPGQY